MRLSAGFATLAAVLAMAFPRMSRNFAQMRLQRAVSVVSADLRLAHSLAERQRTPVTIVVDTATRLVRIRDTGVSTRIYSERRFDRNSEYPLTRLQASQPTLVVYPNGLSSADINIIMTAGTRSRTVSMTRAGQVRVLP